MVSEADHVASAIEGGPSRCDYFLQSLRAGTGRAYQSSNWILVDGTSVSEMCEVRSML